MSGQGPVEDAARVYVASMGVLADLQRPLAELAFSLARTLDGGAGMAAAAVGREYRATLLALREVGDDNAAGADLLAHLSTPVEHESVPGPVLAGLKGGRDSGVVGDAADAVAATRRRRRPGTGP